VNGDATYPARTTRRAVGLVLSRSIVKFGHLTLDQQVDTPIGSGFGASAASAMSGVLAAAAVLQLRIAKVTLAQSAHEEEVLEQTGLGTVSVTYDAVGAGAIICSGNPGVARFLNIKIPKGIRIATAYLAPYDKRYILSSKRVSAKINRLGDEALEAFRAEPTLEVLAEQGEFFSKRLGLESKEVKKLGEIAKKAGAMFASQNMIGYAVHAIVDVDNSSRVAKALKGSGLKPRVDVFEVGAERANVNSS